MIHLKEASSSFVYPVPLMICICLKMVLLPDSPAPSRSILVLLSALSRLDLIILLMLLLIAFLASACTIVSGSSTFDVPPHTILVWGRGQSRQSEVADTGKLSVTAKK